MRALIGVCLLAASAAAEPRVIIADADDKLRTAIADMLRPWTIEIDDAAPRSRDAALAYAFDHADRYVIWREPGALVVLDRNTNEQLRRPMSDGPIDDIRAAAIALSVKTMLRLEPIAPKTTTTTVVVRPPPPSVSVVPPIMRLAITAGGRVEEGIDSNLALRFGASFSVRLTGAWWLFVLGDAGASATVDQAGFHGTWMHFSTLAGASYAWQADDWEFAPWLAAGIQHSSVSGTEQQMSRTETSFLADVRGGFAVRRQFGAIAIGPVAAVEWLPATRTYTQLGGPAKVFEIPPIGASLSLELSAAF